MPKKNLDLSHVLSPLDEDLKELMKMLCEGEASAELFDEAISSFVAKYGKEIAYESIDELLAASAEQSKYLKSTLEKAPSFEEALSNLLN